MNSEKSILYKDLNIYVDFGDYEIRIVHIGYLAPKPNWLIGRHNHHCFEFHYIPSGDGTVYAANKFYHVTAGSFYLVGPYVEHEQLASVENPMGEYGLNFEIIPRHKGSSPFTHHDSLEHQEQNQLLNALKESTFRIGHGSSRFPELFETLKEELDGQYIGYYSNIEFLVSSILILLMRNCVSNPHAHYCIPVKNLNSKRQLLIHDYLTSHYQNARRDELANLLGISTRQLSREMKALYPESSFQKVLLSIRMNQVKKCLENTSDTLVTIADSTGFASSAHLCSAFKQEFHTTPTEYRQETNNKA